MRWPRRLWWVAGLLIALAAVLFSPLASPSPDGLERVAEDSGFIDDAQPPPYDLMTDYSLPFLRNGAASTIGAGIVGTLIVFAAAYGLARVIRRKGRPEAHAEAQSSARDTDGTS